MEYTDLAREIFKKDRYATGLTGIVIDHVDNHEAVCTMNVTEHHCNARKVAMGGALFTLADFSAAVAANSDSLANEDLHWVSLESNIHYLSPAPLGSTLRATSLTLKHGRTTALYQTIIESPDKGRVAVVETTMIYV